MNNSALIIERKPPLIWLTLNRPEAANSLNTELLLELKDICKQLSADTQDNRSLHVVIITAADHKTFCAGADLKERAGMSEQQALAHLNLIRDTFLAVERLPQVVIAALNGSAYGGGTELALACDLRIMVEQATLSLTEVNLGIIPGAGGTQRLPRLIGKSMAKETILTALPITARRAFEIGLVHKLTDNSDLIVDTQAWAISIASAAPLSLRHAKQAIDEGCEKSLAAGMAIELKHYKKLLSSKDRKEALVAFTEKRPPHFTGQ